MKQFRNKIHAESETEKGGKYKIPQCHTRKNFKWKGCYSDVVIPIDDFLKTPFTTMLCKKCMKYWEKRN